MILAPSILCPIDFSESSRGALRYAGVIASHLGARLTLLAVNDPLLSEAAELGAEPKHLVDQTVRELEKFFRQSFDSKPEGIASVLLDVATGKPAPEILRVSRDRSCDLIVMGSHGATGFRKLFFGSTTERVLRETSVPVLVTYGGGSGPLTSADIMKTVRRVLAPVDLTAATAHQLAIARRIAEAVNVPLLYLHVIEPVRSMVAAQPRLPKIDAERKHRAESELQAAVAATPATLKPEILIAYGEPAEEIAKVAHDRDAGLIVMGLHSSPLMGPRMGSVTYRVLCLAHRAVLAVPPLPPPAVRLDHEVQGVQEVQSART